MEKPEVNALHAHAREMRNSPTEPEKRLWTRLSRAQLNGHKFRRQAAIGPFIADFLCPSSKLIVEIDGHTHDKRRDARRDTALAAHGYRVLRFSNVEVMRNTDGVLLAILAVLTESLGRGGELPHPNPSPEGEGPYKAPPLQGRGWGGADHAQPNPVANSSYPQPQSQPHA
jgi:very-short-patch-repair endonuclease